MQVVDVVSRFARCQLVLGSDGVTLVDTGMDRSGTAILAALATAGATIGDLRRIVLTHGDGDHIAAANLLQERSGAEVVAHELELAYVGGRVPRSFPILKRGFGLFGGRLPRPRVTRVMTGSRLDLGDIELVHAPGHTAGHVVVYAGDALLAGDAFRTGETFDETPKALSVDLVGSRLTIRRLAERDARMAYSGHGPPSDQATARLRALAGRLAGSS